MLTDLTAEKFTSIYNDHSKQLFSVEGDVNSLVNYFNSHCEVILNEIAPLKSRTVASVNSTPWLNNNIRCLQRKWRRVERLWKSTKLQVHRMHFKDLLTEYNSMVKAARAAYFADLISSNKRNPKFVFNVINNLVAYQPSVVHVSSVEDCNNFLSFSVGKVASIRASTTPHSVPPPACLKHQPILECFLPVSLQELTELVGSTKSSSSPLDILPTSPLKKVIDPIGPYLLYIINTSLVSGCFPSYFKQAVVQPLLKKPYLDPSLPSNFRPISKLPFLSKILEKVVADQLIPILNRHNIPDKFQSG